MTNRRDIVGIDTVILPGVNDLTDGFKVRRVLPSENRSMIGPFVPCSTT